MSFIKNPPKNKSQSTLDDFWLPTSGQLLKDNWVNRFYSPSTSDTEGAAKMNLFKELSELLVVAPYKSAHWVLSYSKIMKKYYDCHDE